MPKTINYTYCDSCIFLAYFNEEPGRVEILDQLFEEVEKDGDRRLVTSAFSVIEVAHIASEKQYWKLAPNLEQKLDAFWAKSSLVEIIDIHEHLARKARTLMRQAIQLTYSLKGADALHLASLNQLG
jgi:predicted nucleic acid-binding protein